MPSPRVAQAASIHVRDVAKSFSSARGHRLVLDAVNLTISAGQIVAIVGPSGCGKSTLLRLVAGLEQPSAGSISIAEVRVSGPNPRCGMAFQEHRLLPWLTVAQNVEFALPAHAREERERLAARQIAKVGLHGFENAYPHELSGGMAQRAALARALVARPAVLLLDEPFAALDAFTKMAMQEELLRARSELQPTTLLVTHDIEEAVFLADSIVVLRDRPGTVRRVFTLDLQRPRERTSSAFSLWRRNVLRELTREASDEPNEQKTSPAIPLRRPALAGAQSKDLP